MGMFDNIADYECDCPRCGYKIIGFQTKDADCVLDTITPIHEKVEHFYRACSNCSLWVEFRLTYEDEFEKIFELNRVDPSIRPMLIKFSKPFITKAQVILKIKHGTPQEFEQAVFNAIPFITQDEAHTAVELYKKEWLNAGREY